jgi:uncharacterized membrane protein YccF (DUF307 family)
LSPYVTIFSALTLNLKAKMSFIGNVIWVIFGGIFIFFQYIFGGLVLCLTIVGIPFGIQCFKFAIVGLAPFGVKITDTSSNIGCLSTVMNIIWLVFGGIWIVLTHLLFGLFFCITVVGIPFGLQHFKLMNLAFSPFGKSIG